MFSGRLRLTFGSEHGVSFMIVQSLTYLTLAVALGCAPAIQAQPAHLDPANPAGPAARLSEVGSDLAQTEQAPPVSPAATEDKAPQQFTCPMHPEVTSNEPGRCPK